MSKLTKWSIPFTVFLTCVLTQLLVCQQAMATECTSVNITIQSQSDIDRFQESYGGGGICRKVSGDLIIRNISNLTNLDGLKHLREVGGNLEIENNDNGSASDFTNSLVNISGLSELESVGGHFNLDNNSQLSECRWVAELMGWPDGPTTNTTKQAVFANADGCNSIQEIFDDATAVLDQEIVQEGAYQGMWWNPDESGWGINFEHQADLIFVSWYTYDDAGEAWWVTGLLQKTGGGVYSGELYSTTGPAFYSVPFDSNQVISEIAGNMTATFFDSSHGSVEYTLNGVSQTKQIERFLFVTEPVVVPEKEYNDEREFATEFQLGESIIGSLSNLNDVDWFSVNIQTQDMVEVDFDVSSIPLTSPPASWNVYWYDPDMQAMSGRNIQAPDGFIYQFPAFKAGTYYLRVRVTDTIFYNGGQYKVSLKAAR